MRVISGSKKGMKLKSPKPTLMNRIRPLSDFAKESLFNILSARVEGCTFLDLFAGTGQVGIEALSRGAKIAMFVENDRQTVAVIRENLEKTGFTGNSEIFSLDAIKTISFFGKTRARFDIVYIGAPYILPLLVPALENISKNGIVNQGGIVVAEHSKRQKLPPEFGPLGLTREANYGDTVFSFYMEKIK